MSLVKWFRKNNKKVMAVVVIGCMAGFVGGSYLSYLGRSGPSPSDTVAHYLEGKKITRSDLRRKTPYNTYQIKGLPPGPIASPGLKSITAALYPADVPYLYFVSQDDRMHQFSTTAEEHIEAVKLYRQRQQEIKDAETDEENNDS